MSDLPADFILKTELQLAKLQDTLRAWKKAGLPEKTIIVLLADSTKVNRGTIKKILEGIDNLHTDYFTEEK